MSIIWSNRRQMESVISAVLKMNWAGNAYIVNFAIKYFIVTVV